MKKLVITDNDEKRAKEIGSIMTAIRYAFYQQEWEHDTYCEIEGIYMDNTLVYKEHSSGKMYLMTWTLLNDGSVKLSDMAEAQQVEKTFTPVALGQRSILSMLPETLELRLSRKGKVARAMPDEVEEGYYVSWETNTGTNHGRVESIERSGDLTSDTNFTITGTEDDPAALIVAYEYDEENDEYRAVEPEIKVVHRFSTLTVEDPAKYRQANKEQMETRTVFQPKPGQNAGPAREQRTYGSTIEVREKGKELVISGYALKFNQESEDLGGFIEVIDPSALDNADLSDVRALFNHDPNFVLGRTKNGTLKLTVDSVGLRYDITLTNSATVRDLVYTPIQRGDIDQSSFGFTVRTDGDKWEKREDGLWKRTLTDIEEFFDVSPVTFPAYKQTEATARSLAAAQKELEVSNEDLERQQRMADKYMETFNV